jgi:hypothetical protein
MTMRVTEEMLEAARNAITWSRSAPSWQPTQKAMRAALEAALALPQPAVADLSAEAVAKADEERAREINIALIGAADRTERESVIARALAAVRAEERENWFAKLGSLRDQMAASFGWDVIAAIDAAIRQVRP